MPKSRIILCLGFFIALLPELGFPHSWEAFFQVAAGLLIVLLSVLISVDRRLTMKSKAEKRALRKRALVQAQMAQAEPEVYGRRESDKHPEEPVGFGRRATDLIAEVRVGRRATDIPAEAVAPIIDTETIVTPIAAPAAEPTIHTSHVPPHRAARRAPDRRVRVKDADHEPVRIPTAPPIEPPLESEETTF